MKKARLSEDGKRWIMLPLQGNLTRFEEVKTLIRRLPHDGSAEVFLADKVIGNTMTGYVWHIQDTGPVEIMRDWNPQAEMPAQVLAVIGSGTYPVDDAPTYEQDFTQNEPELESE